MRAHKAFFVLATARVQYRPSNYFRCVARRHFTAQPNPLRHLRSALGSALLFAFSLVAASASSDVITPLKLQSKPHDAYDLKLSGKLEGLATGVSGFLPWSTLRRLPTTKVVLNGEFVVGDQEVTVVFLEDIWNRVPRQPGTDVILATCSDGYAAVFTEDFIKKFRPFLVLEINGDGPKKWPPKGLDYNPGPYVITLSPKLVPAAADLLDAPHKAPWGVNQLEFANYHERFQGSFTGRWANLSDSARRGREIWINSCACCHAGPDSTFGGSKSHQAFAILATVARYDPDLFVRYVRKPRSVSPEAQMEAHPHYTDLHLHDLLAFVNAQTP